MARTKTKSRKDDQAHKTLHRKQKTVQHELYQNGS